MADGAIVRVPAAIKELSHTTSRAVLIASRYRNVRHELKVQFISLGLNESDLIAIEF